jgi:hypothetical protein
MRHATQKFSKKRPTQFTPYTHAVPLIIRPSVVLIVLVLSKKHTYWLDAPQFTDLFALVDESQQVFRGGYEALIEQELRFNQDFEAFVNCKLLQFQALVSTGAILWLSQTMFVADKYFRELFGENCSFLFTFTYQRNNTQLTEDSCNEDESFILGSVTSDMLLDFLRTNKVAKCRLFPGQANNSIELFTHSALTRFVTENTSLTNFGLRDLRISKESCQILGKAPCPNEKLHLENCVLVDGAQASADAVALSSLGPKSISMESCRTESEPYLYVEAVLLPLFRSNTLASIHLSNLRPRPGDMNAIADA